MRVVEGGTGTGHVLMVTPGGDAARPGHRKILFHAVNHKGTWQRPQAINEMMAMSRKIARGVGQDEDESTTEDSRMVGGAGRGIGQRDSGPGQGETW